MDELMQEYKGDRKIWVKGELNDKTLTDIVDILNGIIEEDSKIKNPQPVHIYINSVGGDVNTGVTIAKILLKMSAPIYTYNLGLCLSAAMYIFLSGSRRFTFDHCSFMVHATTFGYERSNFNNIASYTEHVKDLIEMNNRFMISRCNLSQEDLNKSALIDFWMNGVEAKSYNIATDLL